MQLIVIVTNENCVNNIHQLKINVDKFLNVLFWQKRFK